MGTAQAQAARRLARSREWVTIRTQTRDTTVDAATGDHTYTDTDFPDRVPAIIFDRTDVNARDADQQRDINAKQFSVKVDACITATLGDRVEFVESADPQLKGLSGTVTTVGRSGRMFRELTVTASRTP